MSIQVPSFLYKNIVWTDIYLSNTENWKAKHTATTLEMEEEIVPEDAFLIIGQAYKSLCTSSCQVELVLPLCLYVPPQLDVKIEFWTSPLSNMSHPTSLLNFQKAPSNF